MNAARPATVTLTAPKGPFTPSSPLTAHFLAWRAAKRAAKLALVGAATLKAANSLAARTSERDDREAQQTIARTVAARITDDTIMDPEIIGAASRIALEADTLPSGHGWSGEASWLLTPAERARLRQEWTPRAKVAPAPVVSEAAEVFPAQDVPPYEGLITPEIAAGSAAILAFVATVEAAPLTLTA